MLRVGIQGMGHIAKKHVQAMEKVAGVEVHAISDIRGAYPSYETLLQNDDIDLISVCTPNSFHAEHALAAIHADKHVICEKPFALKKADCEKIINASLQSGKFLFCVMQNRFSPLSQWLKDVVDKNLLGDILTVNVSCYWNRDQRYYQAGSWKGKRDIDGGTLFTQFAHYVDTIYYLFGDIKINNACFENFTHKDLIEFEDTGNFSFQLGSGGIGNFQYSTSVWDKNFESTMSIVGSEGSIKVAGQYMNEISYCHAKNLSRPNLPPSDNIDNLSKIYSNALEVIQGKNKVMTNAMDGLKVVEIIENVYKFRK